MYQRQLDFKEAVVRALTVNYCNFAGRASRSEYWWYALFTFLLGLVIGFVFSFSETVECIVMGIVQLALILPGLGLCVRRLHDTNKSGWWILLAFIPLIGALVLIFWFCQPSTPDSNEYGPVPNLA
ncbi:MAG: DUF805 domain-containing protein [Muribaculaceae bacterium]|nr:DUF805 domain-containing protein [Muribaculaceae bacterium]